jgi:tight adherence protein B
MIAIGISAIGVGALLLALSWRGRRRAADAALAERLGLPRPDASPKATAHEARSGVVEGAVVLADMAVEAVDAERSFSGALARARMPLRPGEFVIVVAGAALASSAMTLALTKSGMWAVLSLAIAPAVATVVVRRRIAKRKKAFERQLPGALALIASSLAAGHTFLRAIQMMCEESPPPLSEEFARVVAETQLGDSVVEALGRMSERLQIRDVEWVVQAIRIQQTVGGKLSELLHILSDFIRARDEVRREVLVLTAEGRISAWVLGAMPLLLAMAIQVINPGYIDPLYSGWGLVVLVLSAVSVAFGTTLILRMSRIEV